MGRRYQQSSPKMSGFLSCRREWTRSFRLHPLTSWALILSLQVPGSCHYITLLPITQRALSTASAPVFDTYRLEFACPSRQREPSTIPACIATNPCNHHQPSGTQHCVSPNSPRYPLPLSNRPSLPFFHLLANGHKDGILSSTHEVTAKMAPYTTIAQLVF